MKLNPVNVIYVAVLVLIQIFAVKAGFNWLLVERIRVPKTSYLQDSAWKRLAMKMVDT